MQTVLVSKLIRTVFSYIEVSVSHMWAQVLQIMGRSMTKLCFVSVWGV